MPPNKLGLSTAIALAMGGCFATSAQAQQFPNCPTTVEVAQQFTGTAPAGWQSVLRPTDRRVADIRFQNGTAPDAPFIPFASGSGPGPTWSLHYEFPATQASVTMVCIYANTAFTFIREIQAPLPPKASVTYDHVNRAVILSHP
ncbi:STY0301 family protein [Humitalea sp. 24SJ18S-53]|uniref:STY0301 family protein n=1 Tax=Humitalea sp. 24SJ18S-53 TaxID=3422307 RepID=UPI003D666629